MSWGSGYVTDIAYDAGYYSEQSPRTMALTAMICGYAAPLPEPDAPFHFVDLGCGRGFTALMLAATNPGWTVTGLDFHPGHIAAAQALAAQAGIANCRFVEADLSTHMDVDLPAFDAVSMHGVWTWVGDAVQQGILRLLDRKLRPGGLCHVSYNVQPGWGGMVPLQRLMREAGRRLAFRADRQAERGLEIVRRLVGEKGERTDPRTRQVIEACVGKSGSYLAHEFMNVAWRPCFHADVAAAFTDAKLDYVGSPRLLENFPALVLGEPAQEIAREFEDPAMLELIKDITLEHPLRHDIYIRGGCRLAPAARDRMLHGITLGLSIPYGARKLEIPTALGSAAMNVAFYEPIFARLAEGPVSVAELLDVARPPGRPPSADNPAELVAMLLGTRQATIIANPSARMSRAAVALNAAMFAERGVGASIAQPISLAVPALGGAFNLPALGAFAVLRQHDWLNDATAGQALPRPDRSMLERWATIAAPEADAETHHQMANAFESFLLENAPTLNALGLPC